MSYPNTKFQRLLARLNACGPARRWVGRRTLRQAWNQCSRPDWLLWLHARLTPAPWAYAALAEAWAGDAATRAADAAAEDAADGAADSAADWAADAAAEVAELAELATFATHMNHGAFVRQADEVRAVLFCPEVGSE